MHGHTIVKFVVKCVKLLYLQCIDIVILVAVRIVQSVIFGNFLSVQFCVFLCAGMMGTCNVYDVNILTY
jgi:hypothetical protein